MPSHKILSTRRDLLGVQISKGGFCRLPSFCPLHIVNVAFIRRNLRYCAEFGVDEISDSFTDWFFTPEAVTDHLRESLLRY